ncbi:LacI family transcriptional regulator [Mesorhizobium robiniae]|uniref:LacI family transcriptional regulator n=1 Tax=Mesorhizobium robiniae TaxID=559315 RepID=A0ABV2GG28_9HYPH
MAKTNNKPTVKDVARIAGVSPMTVSNVINASGRVGEETADRVREAIQQLGYRQSTTARRFRLSKQWAIGLLVIDENPNFLSDPFTAELISGLTNYLTNIGYSLTIRGIRPSRFDARNAFKGIETDGLVLLLSGKQNARLKYVRATQELKVPTVMVQEPPFAGMAALASVRQDDYGGGALLARHLLETGARVFWMLVTKTIWPALEARGDGFKSILDSIPGARLELLMCENESFEVVYKTTSNALLLGRPDALVGLNDQMAISALRAAQDHGLAAPDDIQITGFNGLAFWKLTNPRLTTVQSCGHDVGYQAAKNLVDALNTGTFSQNDMVLPVRLYLGQTTSSRK